MTLADIQEKKSEQRKREKRLVHFTNALTRDLQNSDLFKKKTKAYKKNADYIAKSFLDYLFFTEHKEIRELTEVQVQHFMLEFAPRKLNLTIEETKDLPEILSSLLIFLETEGHIHNGTELSKIAKKNSRSFLKLMPKQKKTAAKKTVKKTAAKKKTEPEIKVGRNDPCPCGSGKKYKKCCGKID